MTAASEDAAVSPRQARAAGTVAAHEPVPLRALPVIVAEEEHALCGRLGWRERHHPRSATSSAPLSIATAPVRPRAGGERVSEPRDVDRRRCSENRENASLATRFLARRKPAAAARADQRWHGRTQGRSRPGHRTRGARSRAVGSRAPPDSGGARGSGQEGQLAEGRPRADSLTVFCSRSRVTTIRRHPESTTKSRSAWSPAWKSHSPALGWRGARFPDQRGASRLIDAMKQRHEPKGGGRYIRLSPRSRFIGSITQGAGARRSPFGQRTPGFSLASAECPSLLRLAPSARPCDPSEHPLPAVRARGTRLARR